MRVHVIKHMKLKPEPETTHPVLESIIHLEFILCKTVVLLHSFVCGYSVSPTEIKIIHTNRNPGALSPLHPVALLCSLSLALAVALLCVSTHNAPCSHAQAPTALHCGGARAGTWERCGLPPLKVLLALTQLQSLQPLRGR